MSEAKISPRGSSWDDFKREMYTPKELAESKVRMAIIMTKKELAAAVSEARGKKDLSQRDLSKLTGIQQADICKLENANSNPSFNTLVRIAEGMGKRLKIEFV